jgi:RalA-binding protein 1
VRYFTGTYSEEPLNYGAPSQQQAAPPPSQQQQQQFGTADGGEYAQSNRSGSPVKSMGDPLPIKRDRGNSFAVQATNSSNSSNSNISARRVLDRLAGLPSSLPDSSSSPLSSSASGGYNLFGGVDERPNSEAGHYATSTPVDSSPEKSRKQHHHHSQSPERFRGDGRKSIHPSSSAPNTAQTNGSSENSDESASPNKLGSTGNNNNNSGSGSGSGGSSGKPKISGPMNGMPIPSGFNFGGGREKEEGGGSGSGGGSGGGKEGGSGTGGNERRERARSRFWAGWNSSSKTNGKYFRLHISKYLIRMLTCLFVSRRPKTTHRNTPCSIRRPTRRIARRCSNLQFTRDCV